MIVRTRAPHIQINYLFLTSFRRETKFCLETDEYYRLRLKIKPQRSTVQSGVYYDSHGRISFPAIQQSTSPYWDCTELVVGSGRIYAHKIDKRFTKTAEETLLDAFSICFMSVLNRLNTPNFVPWRVCWPDQHSRYNLTTTSTETLSVKHNPLFFDIIFDNKAPFRSQFVCTVAKFVH